MCNWLVFGVKILAITSLRLSIQFYEDDSTENQAYFYANFNDYILKIIIVFS